MKLTKWWRKSDQSHSTPIQLLKGIGHTLAILGAITFVLWLMTGFTLYAVTAWKAKTQESAHIRATAEATAHNIESLFTLVNSILEQLAQDQEFGQALTSGNTVRILNAEERLSHLVPGALIVRLVPDTLEVPDEMRSPHMGYADLEMVRQSRLGQPSPAFYGANTPNAHVAVARRLTTANGVILASLDPKFFLSQLPPLLQGAFDLKQEQLILGGTGDTVFKDTPQADQIHLKGVSWVISYWVPTHVDPGWYWFVIMCVLSISLIGLSAHFSYSWLKKSLFEDQDNIFLMVQDLLTVNMARQYPITLKEMERLAFQLRDMEPPVKGVFKATVSRFIKKDEGPPPQSVLEEIPSPVPSPSAQAVPTAYSAPTPPVAPPPSPPKPPPLPTVPAVIFQPYDIRGVVGKTLTPEIAKLIGRAVGSETRDRGEYTIAVARDGRLSSADLSDALIKGILETGCSVIDLGLMPTPVLYFATHVLNTESGVMVTGDHPSPDINGFKIIIAGESLSEQDYRKLKTRIEENAFHSGQGQLEFRSLLSDYLDRIINDTQIDRALKIVVDCCHGVTSNAAPTLFTELGCEVIPLFCDIDGRFPDHPPDPSVPKNLDTLIATVLQEEADIGIAFDDDGDRLTVIDSLGNIVWMDRLMMLFAADVLSREPGADIVFDVKCTRHLVSYIVRNGGRPLMWRAEHALLRSKMRETGALLAGGMSGHVLFKERWYGFEDGLYAATRLIEILSNDPLTTAEVFRELPVSVSTPELTIELKEGESIRIMEQLDEIAQFPDARITHIDGLRIDFSDGWGLVRASNLYPTLTLRFEGDTQEALTRIINQFESLLRKVKPDIAFPSF